MRRMSAQVMRSPWYIGPGQDDAQCAAQNDEELGDDKVDRVSAQEIVRFSPVQDQVAPGTNSPHLHPLAEEPPVATIRTPEERTPHQEGGGPTGTQLNRIPPWMG